MSTEKAQPKKETKYYKKGSIWMELWYLNGKLHREDGPARIEYYGGGSIWMEWWYLNGKLHREVGPAKIGYYIDGLRWEELWYLNGKQHREDGSASIVYYGEDSIHCEKWFLNDKLHREEGPAVIRYHNNGRVSQEMWYLNDKELKAGDWRFRRLKARSIKTPVDELIALFKDRRKEVREAARARFTKEELQRIDALQYVGEGFTILHEWK